MSVLDNIGKSRVNVREIIEKNGNKIIFDLNMRSVDLYRQSDFDTLWLSFASKTFLKTSVQRELYDFINFHPDVLWCSPVYTVKYYETTFVHPTYDNSKGYRVMIGVKLYGKSAYRSLCTLYSIFMEAKRLEKCSGRGINLVKMTVYWKRQKDVHHYKDYEYNFNVTNDLFSNFYNEKIDMTMFDLTAHITKQKWNFLEDGWKRFVERCKSKQKKLENRDFREMPYTGFLGDS